MKGKHAFCPRTGASLSSDDEHVSPPEPAETTAHGFLPADVAASTLTLHAPQIQPERGDDVMDAPLTGGAKHSNAKALTRRFRECYEQHHTTTPSQLMVAAANAIRTLKKTRTEAADSTVWYALAEHLHREGYDVEWMFNHVEPACPGCGSVLTWERADAELEADRGAVLGRCASNCDATPVESYKETPNTGEYRDRQILAQILTLFNEAFHDISDPEHPGFSHHLQSRNMPFTPEFGTHHEHPANRSGHTSPAASD